MKLTEQQIRDTVAAMAAFSASRPGIMFQGKLIKPRNGGKHEELLAGALAGQPEFLGVIVHNMRLHGIS